MSMRRTSESALYAQIPKTVTAQQSKEVVKEPHHFIYKTLRTQYVQVGNFIATSFLCTKTLKI